MKQLWLAIAALSCLGQASAQSVNPPAVLSAAGGRFVFGQVNGSGAGQYMLDTQTGRLWNVVSFCEDVKKSETCRRGTLVEVKYEPPADSPGQPLPPDPAKQAKASSAGMFEDLVPAKKK